jgi:hypothetical protein
LVEQNLCKVVDSGSSPLTSSSPFYLKCILNTILYKVLDVFTSLILAQDERKRRA